MGRRRKVFRRVAAVRWAGWALLGVLLLQAAVLWTLLVIDPPPTFPELARDLWAKDHELAFWPVVLLILVGPVLTIIALWFGRWPSRLAAVALWPAWLWVMHQQQVLDNLRVMIDVLIKYKL